jgi:kynureninase
VGAKASEVAIMNTLTVNLHLLLVSFYRPNAKRFKIVMESGAFSSDQYAIESQVRFHGFEPSQTIIEITPRKDETILRHEDILQTLDFHADTIALILLGGVNYYTGQFFDIKDITEKGHKIGAIVGFDLAHAAGNVPLQMHDWGVDFGVWCTYKYLNSGPGGVGGAFIHERHHATADLPRFAGWWGYDLGRRFQMQSGFVAMSGAAGWQISTAQVLPFAAHLASLELIAEAGGMARLRQKSVKLTGFLSFLLKKSSNYGKKFWLLTPENEHERGSQLSIYVPHEGKAFFERLTEGGIIGDWREPNVIRLAPVPLYNTFEEVFRVATFF